MPTILKRSGALLISIHFVREMSVQLLNYAAAEVQARGREDLPTLVSLVGLNFIFEILWSAIWAFVLISATRAALREQPLFSSRSLRDFNQLLIEGTRSMAAVLWRLPFAILPGIVEIFRLLFVPHVVLLEPAYARGGIDALKSSRIKIRQKWGLIFVVTALSLGLSAAVEGLLQGKAGETYFWQAPFAFFSSAILTLAISLVYEVYLVAIFLRLNNWWSEHADFQLEAN